MQIHSYTNHAPSAILLYITMPFIAEVFEHIDTWVSSQRQNCRERKKRCRSSKNTKKGFNNNTRHMNTLSATRYPATSVYVSDIDDTRHTEEDKNHHRLLRFDGIMNAERTGYYIYPNLLLHSPQTPRIHHNMIEQIPEETMSGWSSKLSTQSSIYYSVYTSHEEDSDTTVLYSLPTSTRPCTVSLERAHEVQMAEHMTLL